eukprot:1443044-Pleurochrysis_carterae.AAC.1
MQRELRGRCHSASPRLVSEPRRLRVSKRRPWLRTSLRGDPPCQSAGADWHLTACMHLAFPQKLPGLCVHVRKHGKEEVAHTHSAVPNVVGHHYRLIFTRIERKENRSRPKVGSKSA